MKAPFLPHSKSSVPILPPSAMSHSEDIALEEKACCTRQSFQGNTSIHDDNSFCDGSSLRREEVLHKISSVREVASINEDDSTFEDALLLENAPRWKHPSPKKKRRIDRRLVFLLALTVFCVLLLALVLVPLPKDLAKSRTKTLQYIADATNPNAINDAELSEIHFLNTTPPKHISASTPDLSSGTGHLP